MVEGLISLKVILSVIVGIGGIGNISEVVVMCSKYTVPFGSTYTNRRAGGLSQLSRLYW